MSVARVEQPHSRDELLQAFEEQERASLDYWSAFDTASFFRPLGKAWSPAENVRHLTKSTRPVVKALKLPRFVSRLLFGKPRRASLTYEQLRTRYAEALAEGGQAGRFAPSAQREADLDAWRESILRHFTSVNRDLRVAIARWPDPSLDSAQLPHPLLGKLTVREMLFFTLYHSRHHIAVAERRRTEQP